MLKFFKAIFSAQARRAPRQRGFHLGVEELTPRVLPSTGCAMAAGGASAQAARFGSSTAGNFSSESDEGHDCGGRHGADHATLAGSLSNSSGATGTASFNESAGSLYVTVKGAAASSTLSVTPDRQRRHHRHWAPSPPTRRAMATRNSPA